MKTWSDSIFQVLTIPLAAWYIFGVPLMMIYDDSNSLSYIFQILTISSISALTVHFIFYTAFTFIIFKLNLFPKIINMSLLSSSILSCIIAASSFIIFGYLIKLEQIITPFLIIASAYGIWTNFCLRLNYPR